MKAKLVNFERGQDPKDALNLGLWKDYEPGVFIPLQEFKDNGGELKEGREIFNAGGVLWGNWKEYDSNQQVDIMSGGGYKSRPVPDFAIVKVPTKIMYK